MKFGVISPGRTDAVVEKARSAEELGFDWFGVSDTHLLTQETYATLGAVGGATDRIDLGPTVTNPVTRHPSVTASAVATVAQHTGERAVLGISTGDSAVFTIGERPARLAELEATVRACKALWRGETATYDGEELEMAWLREDVSPSATEPPESGPVEGVDVPVAVAAEGPNSLELAGRVADRVVVGLGKLPEVVDASLDAVERGARAAGRDPAAVETWLYLHANVGPDRGEAVEALRHRLAGVAHHSLQFTFEGKAVPDRFHERLRALVEGYDPGSHGLPGENADLVDDELLGYLGRRYALAGTPAECRHTLRAVADRGRVDGVLLVPYGDHPTEIERIGESLVGSV
jgi:5,10-methylenetetrahydromethanopterin reductase